VQQSEKILTEYYVTRNCSEYPVRFCVRNEKLFRDMYRMTHTEIECFVLAVFIASSHTGYDLFNFLLLALCVMNLSSQNTFLFIPLSCSSCSLYSPLPTNHPYLLYLLTLHALMSFFSNSLFVRFLYLPPTLTVSEESCFQECLSHAIDSWLWNPRYHMMSCA
jgi:hypothetical protein